MAGVMYLGNQKVTPVIVQGGGSSETPVTIFKFADDMTELGYNEDDRNFAFPLQGNVVDFNNLEIISGAAWFRDALYGSYGFLIKAKKLKVISGSSVFAEAFMNASAEDFDFDFSTIEEISGGYSFFLALYNLSNFPPVVRFTNLRILTGKRAFGGCFGSTNVSGIYFNSLTSQSFGSNTDQFRSMLEYVADCTVHFPSNLEPVIGNWSDVLAGFGGTNTTVLFDLEATEN